MSFAAPLFLLGLLLVPVAVAAYVRSERGRARRAAAFASPALLGSVAPRRPGWRRHVPVALYAAALSALLVALARPQATVAVEVEQAQIVLVTDVSGSMQARDVAPSRLAAAKAAGRRLLDEVPERVRVGLVAFNGTARVLSAPTTDRDRLRRAVDGLRESGGTATGEGIAAGLAALNRPTGRAAAQAPPAAIVLLSDGTSTAGRQPLLAAREARARAVPIYTVALGTPTGTIRARNPDGSFSTRRVPPDLPQLERIAGISRGQAFTARTTGQLGAVYEDLGSRATTRDEEREVTNAFAAGALLLVALGSGLSLHWFRRVA
jgi:Ca-activated chloride channel family protein